MERNALVTRAVTLLKEKGLTVATAESCTGGMIAAAITDVAGASRVFGTGVVSYSCDCKMKLLGVSAATLETEGAVCAATAAQMAEGVRRVGDAAIGVSVTGEAGPIAAENHPVGTVFIGYADENGAITEEHHFEGDRAAIRRQAVEAVLVLLVRRLEGVESC